MCQLLWLIKFMWIVVGTKFIRTSFRYRFCAIHHKRVARGTIYFWILANSACGASFDCVLAVGVAGAAIEDAEAAFTLCHKTLFAHRAGDTGVV